MDLKKLIYFTAVADCGSFTKAAAQLRVAQPALSRQISLLEKEFGLELLTRMDRQIRPTDAGQVLLTHARELIKGFERARNEMQLHGRCPRGRVTIGAPPSLGTVIVPKVVERMQSAFPDVELKVREGNALFLEHSIVDAEVDLALLAENPHARTIMGETLAKEDIALIGRPNILSGIDGNDLFSIFERMPIALSQQVNALVRPELEKRGIELPRLLEIDALHAIKELTLQGRCLALMPIAVFRAELEARGLRATRLHDVRLWRPIVLAYSALRTPSVAIESIAQLLREEVHALKKQKVFSLEMNLDERRANVPEAVGIS